MKKLNKPAIILAGVLLIGGFLFWLLSSQPQSYSWSETFEPEGRQPYDIRITRSLLPDFFPEKEFHTIENLLRDTAMYEREGAAFIYIDGWARIDSLRAVRLSEFAEKGNTVFISATNAHWIVQELCKECLTAKPGQCLLSKKAKTIRPVLASDDSTNAEIHFQYMDKKERYPWHYLDLSMCNGVEMSITGSFEAIDKDYTNMVEITVGQGQIILHTTPLIFSNYHIIHEEVLAHAEAVLKRIPPSHIYFMEPDQSTPRTPNRPLLTESPLRFILGNDGLRWAWYLLLGLSVLYTISQMRRMQRPIPVLAKAESNTLGLVEVMSRFYQKEGKHKHLIQLQLKMLLNHLRRKYRIQHKPGDEAFYQDASVKLQKSPEALKAFFQELHRAQHNSTLSDAEFLALDRKITEFYATCP